MNYLKARLVKKIVQVLRAPTIKVVVDIFGFVGLTDRVARHKKMNGTAFFEYQPQGLQLLQGIECVLKGVIGNNDIH